MDYLITAPVVFRSLAICGIEGVNVPTTNTSISKLEKRKQLYEMTMNKQFNRPHADTVTRMIFFLVGENRR